jgi:hypothetical protein
VAKRIQLAAVYYMHTGINRQFETGGDDETMDEPTQFTLDADHPATRARTGVS